MYRHPKYPNLFSPLKVNKLVLKNRIIYAPVEAYFDRALAGSAIMMRGTSGTLNDYRCRIQPGSWLFDPKVIKHTKEELMIIKRGGSFAALEVMHGGVNACVPAGDYVIGPSDGVRQDGRIIRGMDQVMMDDLIAKFVETVRLAKEIGYDMITMHFAHGWLATQFLAPAINKRNDRYGGSFENRALFPKMILRAVRQALGKDYPIDMRISAFEGFEGCATAEEVIRFINEVAEEGFIDMVNVSYGSHATASIGNPFTPDMGFADYAKEIKQVVKIPVAAVGKIMTPAQAEQILAEGKADLVVIGRASIADPWWAKKAYEDRAEDIIPCILCGKCFQKCCPVQLRNYQETVIPLVLKKTKEPKKVVVIGGGPAGMKAAITAAQRGHKTVLFEASSELGGLIKAANYDENKRELKRYLDYLVNQVNKSDIELKLNVKATPDLVKAENPDQLILATGSLPLTPRIKGVEFAKQAVEVFTELDKVGERVIIIGGGLVGSELAATLALRKHQVTLVEQTDVIGGRNDDTTFQPYRLLVTLPNVTMMTSCVCREIKEKAVILETAEGITELPADTVILAVGFRSNNDNIEDFYGITPQTTIIGDLRRPATIRECEEQGYFSVAEI